MNKTRVRLAALLLAVSFALSGCSLVKNIGGSSGAGTKTITRPAVESQDYRTYVRWYHVVRNTSIHASTFIRKTDRMPHNRALC